MENKAAFVFDTNFIIQVKKLDEVVSNLSDHFSVYVTQVSIDERIAQQCRELKSQFEELDAIKEKYEKIASIRPTTTYETRASQYKTGIQSNYEKLFGNKIIPLPKDEDTFTEVLDRAYRKVAPFSSADNASDKGFKDSLIWISLLRYFKNNGEENIIFVTSDNGFKNNIDALTKEFCEITGKTIEIQDNSYYKQLLEVEQPHQEATSVSEILPDVTQIRERIQTSLDSICAVEVEGAWGEPEWWPTFTLWKAVDGDYMQAVFDALRHNISEHLFDKSVPASEVLSLDSRLTDGNANIPMAALEDCLILHNEIKKYYPDYMEQFYSTSAKIINQNYKGEPVEIDEEDGELPF